MTRSGTLWAMVVGIVVAWVIIGVSLLASPRKPKSAY